MLHLLFFLFFFICDASDDSNVTSTRPCTDDEGGGDEAAVDDFFLLCKSTWCKVRKREGTCRFLAEFDEIVGGNEEAVTTKPKVVKALVKNMAEDVKPAE